MNLCKKTIAFILSMLFIVSLFTQCFAVSYYDVDMKSLKEVHSFKSDEKVVNIVFSNPIILVLLEKNNQSILQTSKDVGKTWSEINLTEKYDGFKANGMFKDGYVWSGAHIFGSKNGKMALLHSSSYEGWENVLCDVSKLNGEILNMVSCYDGYKIYSKLEGNLTLITTRSLSYDLQMIDIDIIPENIFINNNIFVSYTEKSIDLSTDGIHFSPIKINNMSSIEKCEIYDADCSATYITVVYKTNKNQLRNALIELIYENNNAAYKIIEEKNTDNEYEFMQIGEWGLPIIVLKNDKLYRGMVKEDAEASVCKKNDTSWVYQSGLPDDWAFKDVTNMASKGILTPWTLPEDFRDDITREIFCKYIYNLLEGKLNLQNVNVENEFSDCKNRKVNVIADLKIIKGIGENKFVPERKITREEAITVIGRTVNLLNLKNDNSGIIKEFNDFESIADWAKNDVKTMQIMKIINGDNAGNFNPKSNLSVQESLSIIARIYRLMQPQSGCSMCE